MEKTVSLCPQCGFSLPESAPQELCPRCTMATVLGEASNPDSEDNPSAPKVVGITIHEEVGQGGFGVVYRATQTATVKRQVALKVLKPGVDTREVLRRFEVEKQALALLKHPYIAQIYEAGETSRGYPYFTMEYISGVPITDAFVTGEVEPILETFLMVCLAVEHAHVKRVIHRDLKPSNILVNLEGLPKVIDFGIAKATDSQMAPGMTHYTGGASWLGTPAYMAPEQANPSEVSVDARADLYSLGAVLYEVLTGWTPLEAAAGDRLSPEQARQLIEKEEVIPKPSAVASRKFSSGLDDVILRALAHKPEDRYPTVKAFADDLRRVMDHRAIVPAQKRSIGKWWGFGVAALFGFVAIFFLWDSGELPSTEGTGSTDQFHRSAGTPLSLEFSREGSHGLAVFRGGKAILFHAQTGEEVASIQPSEPGHQAGCFSEDGSRFCLISEVGVIRWYDVEDGRELGGDRKMALHGDSIDHCQSFTIATKDSPILLTLDSLTGGLQVRKESGVVEWRMAMNFSVEHLQVSPSARKAVVAGFDGMLHLVNLTTQRVIRSFKAHDSWVVGVTAASDIGYIASVGADGTVAMWDWSGGERNRWAIGEVGVELAITSDGRLLAAANEDGKIVVWDTKDGNVKWQSDTGDGILDLAFSPRGKYLCAGGSDGEVRVLLAEDGELAGSVWEVGSPIQQIGLSQTMDHQLVVVTLIAGEGVKARIFTDVILK